MRRTSTEVGLVLGAQMPPHSGHHRSFHHLEHLLSFCPHRILLACSSTNVQTGLNLTRHTRKVDLMDHQGIPLSQEEEADQNMYRHPLTRGVDVMRHHIRKDYNFSRDQVRKAVSPTMVAHNITEASVTMPTIPLGMTALGPGTGTHRDGTMQILLIRHERSRKRSITTNLGTTIHPEVRIDQEDTLTWLRHLLKPFLRTQSHEMVVNYHLTYLGLMPRQRNGEAPPTQVDSSCLLYRLIRLQHKPTS